MQEAGGTVRWVLRAEGLAVLALAAWIYGAQGFGWTTFALLFFAPDLAFVGYLADARTGAVAYNAAHSLVGALLCAGIGAAAGRRALLAGGLIWTAHVGFDRALGYGLKYARGFGHTHLGRIGRARGA